ncbi:MAG: hypothetical protein C0410_02275 [Anaerolinea sp.]|nr:hypothetical protein [Anaerolinea sp.]
MIKRNIFGLLVIIVLSFTLFACSAEGKEKPSDTNTQAAATEAVATEAVVTEQPAASINSEFPMLPDATNVTDLQGTLMYQTATSMTDTFNFYKKELAAKGLTENEILTLNDATVSQLVFTGSDNGKSLIVQMTKLSDKAIAVSIRYE